MTAMEDQLSTKLLRVSREGGREGGSEGERENPLGGGSHLELGICDFKRYMCNTIVQRVQAMAATNCQFCSSYTSSYLTGYGSFSIS